MLRAVFVRTLRAGVTYEQFLQAWAPPGAGDGYPAQVRVARNVANDRQIITMLELDMSPDQFETARASLTRPDALARLEEIVETTELQGLFEDVFDETSFDRDRGPGPATTRSLR